MSPKVSANIKKVVLSSEYVKSFQCQSEGLRLLYQNKPHFMRYLDLKTFWAKLVLWIISCISRLIEEMFIQNKKNGHNIKEVIETSILCFGIPSVGFYADNGGEFINIKIDKLMATLRVVTKEKNNREEKSSTYWFILEYCPAHPNDPQGIWVASVIEFSVCISVCLWMCLF